MVKNLRGSFFYGQIEERVTEIISGEDMEKYLLGENKKLIKEIMHLVD